MRLSAPLLARSSARHPFYVIGLWLLALVGAGAAIVFLLPGALTAQYDFFGATDSETGRELVASRMDREPRAHEIVIVRAPATAGEGSLRAAVLALQGEIAALGPDEVEAVASAYRGGDQTLLSEDGRTALLPIVMAGDIAEAEANIDALHEVVHAHDGRGGYDTLITGTASIASDFTETAERDLRQGEAIGVPIALVILLLVFGALIAATLPFILALVAITAAIALTALVGQAFDVSVFVINMISMMGLATGIDYSLFIVSRFREERARGREKIDAIAVTGSTASRAVFFSGMTVVLALLGMLVVPTNLFASLAIGAILVVSMAVLAALTLLPAVLGLLGDRVNSLRVPYLGRRLLDAKASGRPSLLARVAQRAMRRPGLALAAGAGVLLLAAAPAFLMDVGVSGVNTFPDGFDSKRAIALLAEEFPGSGLSAVEIVVDAPAGSPATQTAVGRLEEGLATSGAFGPALIETSPAGDLTLITATLPGDAAGTAAIEAVRDLRERIVPAAFGGGEANVYVTGETAFNVDYMDVVNRSMPYVVAIVLSLSFVLLLVAFRSIVIPATAIVMNLLSVGAAFGLITLVSQEGVGAGLLGFQQVATIEQWVPLFLFSVLFGLSMDYQVFLLSRIKEEYDRTGDNKHAVARGIGSTAGIITGAALIMVAVFAGFASGDLVMFQQMGFGLAVAVLLDATLVRTLLVPAAMSLLGSRNWYLPRSLAWLPRLTIEGAAEPLASAVEPRGAVTVATAGGGDEERAA
jgi:RND superfamily putative drug exporter